MRKKIILILFTLIFFQLKDFSDAKIANKIILKVENEIITNYEIKNKILTSLVLAGDEINQANINALKQQAVESLIQQKLKKIELERYKIKKNDQQIYSYLNSIAENDIISLKEKFEKNNLDYQLFLNEVEIQSKWQNLIFLIYSKKIEINENSIDNDLKKIIENEKKLEEFKISEIEILVESNENETEKILFLKSQIKEQGFETAALKYSISSSAGNKGDLGWISSKSLTNKILNIIKKMKPGDISEPIKRQNSVLFLKLNDKKISNIENINKVELKQRLIDQKKNELFNLYSKSHLSKLKNTSLIEYK